MLLLDLVGLLKFLASAFLTLGETSYGSFMENLSFSVFELNFY